MELGQLATAFSAIMPLGDEDFLALRKKSGFLPNILPDKDEQPEPEPTTPETDNTTNADDSLESDGTPELDGDGEMSEFATPAKRLQTLEEKIKDMPDYLQDDINGLAAEFGTLRKVSRREGVARLDEITDEAWDNAVVESLEEGE